MPYTPNAPLTPPVGQGASGPASAPGGLPGLLGPALCALGVSLFFHSPRLWILFGPPVPGAAAWARGLQFMQQCEHPFSPDLLDAGLLWRLAPALLGHALHLRGGATLVIPWLGLLLMLMLTARLARRFTADERSVWLFTSLIGTTSATLTVTGWLGFNDAWYASALLLVAFQPQTTLLAMALFVGPWIDERFLLGLPLAMAIRTWVLGRAHFGRELGLAAAGIALYLTIRLANPLGLPAGRVVDYLRHSLAHFTAWLPWTTLGWFMGLRAAWLLALAPLGWCFRDGQAPAAGLLGALLAAPLAGITLVAADTSRAPTMLLPLVFFGLVQTATRCPVAVLRWILASLLAANLLMPAMHVTYKDGDIINALPIEIARLMNP